MTNNNNLAEQARIIRLLILDMIYNGKTPHIGTAMSCTDILTVLYFGNVLRVNPNKPNWKNRDKFILSKGHGCTALYATLAVRGFFPVQTLEQYGKDGSIIPGHNTLHSLPGIETSNGSLGHGLALGIGMAWAARKNNKRSRIFVLVGDGECQEGSVWEGIMFAGFHKMSNLVLIVDNNNLETLGKTDKIVNLESLVKKFDEFGWSAKRIDGHSMPEITEALRSRTEQKPTAIVAQTVKGKGVSFMENRVEWHGKCPNQEEYERAKKELGEIKNAT